MPKKNTNKVPRSRKTGGSEAPGDQIVKKMTIPNKLISTSAGSVIAVDTTTASSLVQTAPASEWASFAARYQQYRVRQVRVRACPTFPVSSAPFATGAAGSGTEHSQLYVADYIGTSVPATAAQILSDERSSVHCTFKEFTFVSTWKKNPNAKLWNPTGAAPPAANVFGICWASNTNATLMPPLAGMYAYDVEFVVEFRGSQ